MTSLLNSPKRIKGSAVQDAIARQFAVLKRHSTALAIGREISR
jgi:hypothetical protein